MKNFLKRFLQQPRISRIRRNHGLEHATIHLLSQKYPHRSFVGRSDAHGFWLYGDVPTSAVVETVEEALTRLQNGEHQLAVHPNCGTNFVTAGLLGGTASFLSLAGSEDEGWSSRWERLPLAITLTTLALIVAQPLGRAAQRHITTQGDPENLRIKDIERVQDGATALHRVLTQD
ncbi:MAG: DUF6391 domain-containing protein [Anaerolineales bacterium]|jgi:hypothetical protein